MAAPSLPLGPVSHHRRRGPAFRRLRSGRACAATSSPSPGLVVLALMVLAAVFAKQLAPFDPNFIDNVHWQGTPLPPCFQDAAQCGGHPLGTDEVGRDLLSRLLFGARISLTVGLFAVLMEVLIGTMLGAIAGYYGGWVDYALMRVTDVFLSIPLLPLLARADRDRRGELVEGGAELRSDRHHHRRALVADRRASGASLVPESARARVRRSRAGGRQQRRPHHLPAPASQRRRADHRSSDARRRRRHPHRIDASRFSASASSRRPRPGATCSPTPSPISQIAWWAAVFPGLCILVTVLAINYIGDGLRDALDPNMR